MANAHKAARQHMQQEPAQASPKVWSPATIPPPGQPSHVEMMEDLRAIFDRAAGDGRVWRLGEVKLCVAVQRDRPGFKDCHDRVMVRRIDATTAGPDRLRFERDPGSAEQDPVDAPVAFTLPKPLSVPSGPQRSAATVQASWRVAVRPSMLTKGDTSYARAYSLKLPARWKRWRGGAMKRWRGERPPGG